MRLRRGDAPVALSVDDTKLHSAMSLYHDGGNQKWKIAGIHGHIPEFANYDELKELLDTIEQDRSEEHV